MSTAKTSLQSIECCIGDLASHDWWDRNGDIPPDASPPENLQRVIADVFQEEQEHAAPSQGGLQFPKTAPPESLLVRQACLVA